MNLDPLTSREQAEHEDMERQDDWAEAQHRALLESYCRKLWDETKQYPDALYRLEVLCFRAGLVQQRGVKNDNESDYQLNLLLSEWGCGKLIAYFGALAETEGQ